MIASAKNKQRITPPRTVEPCECQAKPSADRASCGVCDNTVAGGAIVNTHPVFDPVEGCMTMLRRFYCDHCDHVVNWTEACNADLRPQGFVISGPGYIRGRARIERFLRENPQASGVTQR